MFKKIIWILMVCALGMLTIVRAQNSPGLQTVVMPSPNAASLGKYGEIPVSLYTGIPKIEVPLYTLKGRELELPISLTYHASGVRVEEIASMVGIGWSLNAGGVITRSIRGMPDDVGGGYFGSYANSTALAKKYLALPSPTTSVALSYGNAQSGDQSALSTYLGGTNDGQPDIFYYNFGKYSGSFFMNQNGQFVASPLEALKIQYNTGSANNGRITQWTVTTPDGVRYIFGSSLDGTVQAWENNTTPVMWGTSTTGWYLVQMISPHNDTISLNYTNVSYSYQSRSSEVLNQVLELVNGGIGSLPFRDLVVTTNNMTVPRLTSITAATGTVVFNAGASRLDLPGENTLGSIGVYSEQNTGSALRSWQFYYDYSTNRLTLDSVQELSGQGKAIGRAYRFAYNGSLPDVTPDRTAINAQDLWGYYNGETSNSVFPQGYETYSIQFGTVSVQGADRHTDTVYDQYGALNKITYPTGGYSRFDYETNKVYTQAGDNSIPAQPVPKGALIPDFFYNSDISDTFTIQYPNPATGTVSATMDIQAMAGSNCPMDNNGFSQCYNVTLRGIDGTQFSLDVFPDGSDNITLAPGTYVLEAQGEHVPGQDSSDVYHAELDWTEYPPAASSPNALVNKAVGGLRIKRITNFDGATANVTKYLYTTFGDTTSSGVLVNKPYNYANVFEEEGYQCNGGNSPTFAATIYLQLQGFPLIPLAPTQGSVIGYRNVTKLIGENGEGGKEEYTYTTANDFPDVLDTVRPYAPSTSYDWRRGKLLRTTTYKNFAGAFVPVKAVANGYLNGIKSSAGYGLTVAVDAYASGGCAIPVSYQEYFVGAFQTISEFQYKRTDTTWLYDENNPNAYVRTINNYTYDTVQGHYQLTKTVTTDSKNELVETDYAYPPDLTLSGAQETARQNLVSNFILTPVLDKKNLRNGVQTIDTKNNYQVFGNGYAQLQSIDQQIGTFPLQRRMEFLSYDSYGHIVQQHKVNDVVNSYVWSYNHSYPIASVLSPSASVVMGYTSFEADGTGGIYLDDNGAGIVATDGITGTHCFNINGGLAMFNLDPTQSYVVSLWAKNGTPSFNGFNGSTQTVATTTNWTVGKSINGWTYLEATVSGVTTINVGGGGGLVDEVRFYPANAQMTTYTYEPSVGMTSQCDVANRLTYYFYDGLGRLSYVKDQDGNIVKTYQYHFEGH